MKYDYSKTVDFLLDWYELNARILPWRENQNPYYIWISEIMCQQTRVEAVKFYFERFITELPEVKDLALVEEEKLLKLWEGLGYYNRARNLKKAAQIVMDEFNGKIPNDYDSLLSLPGIGSYTAGAISSIAFGINRPAVDGNVLRVMKRVAGSFDDITKDSVKKELEADLREVMPKDKPGDFNQAIMELGALVCIPNGKPLCDKCPLMHMCEAYHKNIEMSIPVKAAKKPRKIEDRTILLIEKNGDYMIKKRPSKGLLQGLWELPSIDGKLGAMVLTEKLSEMGYHNFDLVPLGESKHVFSHIEWHMTGFLVSLSVEKETLKEEEIIYGSKWVSKKELDNTFSLPTAFKYYKDFMK